MEDELIYRTLSQALNKVLDFTGLDEATRQRRIKCQKLRQLLWVWMNESLDLGDSFLLTGSSYETTTIYGLSSDVDNLMISKDSRAINDKKDWIPKDNIRTYLMDGTGCPAAFVKLKLLVELEGNIICVNPNEHHLDKEGNIFLHNDNFHKSKVMRMLPTHRKGPAMKKEESRGFMETDYVPAIQCHCFPSQAEGWKTRQTPETRSRLPEDIFDKATYCYVVGKGAKGSPTEHLEWRLSFTHIESRLIHAWNNTQYKCYVVMKILHKEFLKPEVEKIVPEDELCSYHLKTILLWMNEKRPVEFFTEKNLGTCLLECLKNLLDSIENGTLPHYFIEGCDLFVSLDQSTKECLAKLLTDIINSWPQCLENIEMRGVGGGLHKCMTTPLQRKKLKDDIRQDRIFRTIEYETELLRDLDFVFRPFAECLFKLYGRTESDTLSLLKDLIKRAERECQDTDSKNVIQFFQTSSLCNLGLNLIRGESKKSKDLGNRYIDTYVDGCTMEIRLAVACHYVMAGNYQRALTLLRKIESDMRSCTDYMCVHMHCAYYRHHELEPVVTRKKPTMLEFCKYYCVSTVSYQRKDILHVPKALQYEMFRTTSCCPKVTDHFMEWHNEAVIHCPVYLYYLRFLCFQALNRRKDSEDALKKMVAEAQKLEDKNCPLMGAESQKLENKNCPHTETNHNIIGHCYAALGNLPSAFQEFRKSLNFENHHNAAKWHIGILINSVLNGEVLYSRT